MGECMGGIIAATTDIAANEANPEIGLRMADAAFIKLRIFTLAVADVASLTEAKVILGVSADWTAGPSPFLYTGTVEDMLAEHGQEPRRLVHAF